MLPVLLEADQEAGREAVECALWSGIHRSLWSLIQAADFTFPSAVILDYETFSQAFQNQHKAPWSRELSCTHTE